MKEANREFTDTERLNWLAENASYNLELDHDYSAEEAAWAWRRGAEPARTLREAIDEELRKEARP